MLAFKVSLYVKNDFELGTFFLQFKRCRRYINVNKVALEKIIAQILFFLRRFAKIARFMSGISQ